MNNFAQTVRDAVRFYLKNGYTSTTEFKAWMASIRVAAGHKTNSETELASQVTRMLERDYKHSTGAQIFKRHQGISSVSIEALRPDMRRELDRRIVASVSLIKLNRQKAIDTTLSRFAGWATSIPPDTDFPNQKPKVIQVAKHIEKTAIQLDYEARRVAIDQGRKMIRNIDAVIATQNEAIAMEWHSHWRKPGYDYRVDHKERDELIYLIRGSWAEKQGLVKPGPPGYLDEITQPAEEVFCQCYGTYIYRVNRLPANMLTDKALAMRKV